MIGAWRKHWTLRGRTPSLTGVLVMAGLAGCGGEQRSGVVSRDTTPSSSADTAVGPSSDTSAQVRDTSGMNRSESTTTRADTAKVVAAKPAAPKPTPRPAKPKPAAQAKPSDTTASTATSSTGTQPAESSAAPSQTAEAGAPLRDAYHTAPLDTVPQQVYDGWKQFNLNCARCHGEDAQGTTIAPHLIVSLRPDGPINTKELFIQTVCAGRPPKGMPSWCALGMEMPTIEAIYSYVKGRSDAKIHPGRPAVKSGG
jgi:mono/diheme cytochrome c family protein